MAVNNIIKRIQNIMRSDAGINGDAQRIEQMTWMFFLKVYDTQEETWEYKAYKEKKDYTSIIPEPLRWRNWAIDEKDGEALTGDALLSFINNVLFPVIKGQDAEYNGETIKGIVVSAETPRSKSIVQETFADLNQYMKDGTLLRQVVNIVNEIEFDDADDRHTFGDIYEGILKDLQSAGNAGEFYTPRALTDFIVKMLNPQLGETFGDFTSGTGGFLTSALNHMAPQVKSAADGEKLQRAVVGQEWKPLPYLLSITNLLLHDIEAPNIRHCDSLGTNVSDFKDSDKVDVIGMNPPYGGSTGTSVQSNFPSAYRSSETADLFIALIIYRLKAGGRCGVIIPDGFLFGTDGAKLALKEALLRKFNLHTIIRLPGSIFAPYTSIATNILFFNNEEAEGAPEGFHTKETWFYRLDMPEGYKHFSKTKPMKVEHTQPIQNWWYNREEIIDDEVGEKSRCFSSSELMSLGLNFDQCKPPKNEDVVLTPTDLFEQFHSVSEKYLSNIYGVMNHIQSLLTDHEPDGIEANYQSFIEFSEMIKNVPESLRKSILQEAVQGRLVKQNLEDKPASCLLAKIEEKKKQLLADGTYRKKDFESEPISESEIPFEIPENWSWIRLNNLAVVARGGSPRPIKDFITDNSNGVNWIKIGDTEKGGKYINSCAEKIKPEGVQRSRMVHPGDFLLTNSMSFGRPYITNVEGCIHDGWLVISQYLQVYDSDFLYYLLSSPFAFAQFSDKTAGAVVQNLNKDKVAESIFPLPPIEEQRRIVEKIEELFAVLK